MLTYQYPPPGASLRPVRCVACGAVLSVPAWVRRGDERQRMHVPQSASVYCGPACKQRAYRQRKAQVGR